MDMSEFDVKDEEEDDYNLFDFFIMKPDYPLQPLIEYRIKLLLKNDTIFFGGETCVLNTCCIIKRKVKGVIPNLSMHLIPHENLPLGFESRGYISQKYRGRIMVKLINYSANSIKLNSGSVVGYIVMQPLSLL